MISREIKNGPITTVCVKNQIVTMGHNSGCISFFDKRNKKMIEHTENGDNRRVNWSLGPSGLPYADSQVDQTDYYPVKTCVQDGFKLVAAGGPIWNPIRGSYSMGALSIFE